MKKPFNVILYCFGVVFAIVLSMILPYASSKSYMIEKLHTHELPSQSLAVAMVRYYFLPRTLEDIVPFIIGMIVPPQEMLSCPYGYGGVFVKELQHKQHPVILTILLTAIVMQINYMHVPLPVNLMINTMIVVVHVALGSIVRTIYIRLAKRFKVSLFE